MVEVGDFISEADVQLIKEKIAGIQEQPMETFQRNIKVVSYLTYLLKKWVSVQLLWVAMQ